MLAPISMAILFLVPYYFHIHSPFVGFRTSIDGGNTWAEPKAANGENLTVANPLFEILGEPVKFGAPHVVDHGPENVHSPDGSVYVRGADDCVCFVVFVFG